VYDAVSNILYSLCPKLVVSTLSRYTCIYVLKHVYLDKVEATTLGRREYYFGATSNTEISLQEYINKDKCAFNNSYRHDVSGVHG
jgi:hypothetical protein